MINLLFLKTKGADQPHGNRAAKLSAPLFFAT